MTGPGGRAPRPGPPRWLSIWRGRRPPGASERLRRPQPLLKQRMPSGRGAMEQPNITSGGAGVLTPRFWVMVALTGMAAGLLGAVLMLILFNVQYAAFGYHSGSLQHGVEQASAARRVASLLIAGAFGGVAWFLLRRYTKGEPSELDEAVWNGDGRLSFRRCLGTSVISEVVIGMGASIGREAAPKLLGGASGSVLAGWAACRHSSGGCWWRAAAAPGSPPSTTSRWPAPCSPPRSSSAASPCPSCCPPSRAPGSRPPRHGYTCPITPPIPASRTTGSPGR